MASATRAGHDNLNPARTRNTAQWFAIIVGLTLVLVGLLGFIADATFDTGAGGGLLERVTGVLDDARHRPDRVRLGDALLDEHRQHEVGRTHSHVGHQPAQRRRAAQTTGADDQAHLPAAWARATFRR